MYTPKTSHKLAKELLALPDLPVECCAADCGGYDVTNHGVVIKFEIIDNEYIFIHSEEIPNEDMYTHKCSDYFIGYAPKYRKQTLINQMNAKYAVEVGND